MEICHNSNICGSNAPFIASTEKANCEHSTKITKLISTFREENKGAFAWLGRIFKWVLLHGLYEAFYLDLVKILGRVHGC